MVTSIRSVPTDTVVYQPAWSDATGWNQAMYYSTIQTADVNGDGNPELIARSPQGIQVWTFNIAIGQWEPLNVAGNLWNDATGWNQVQYYDTIQSGRVYGSGQVQLIGRGPTEMFIENLLVENNTWSQETANCGWTDANNWNQVQYYSTIQAADINGDGLAELIGRGEYGVDTWQYNIATNTWSALSTRTCNWTDANGWDNPAYYSTIQAADINGDGKAELIGRGSLGIDTWGYDPTNGWQALSTGACNWTDANGWDDPAYYSTIQAADVNGDGQAELIGRGSLGIDVWSYNSSSGWQALSLHGTYWTDGNGWNSSAAYYSTIQAADVNGDGQAELIGRGSLGIETWFFDIPTSQWVQIGANGCGWTDGNGWNSSAAYYSTIQAADVNGDGQAELIGRSPAGIETWVYNSALGIWQQPTSRISIDARFMENYVLASPVHSLSQITTAQNSNGDLELFSLGTDNQVYNIYPDPTSSTGWSQVPVGVSATQVTAGRTPSGALAVFAAQANGLTSVLQNPPGSTSRWGIPQTVAGISGVVNRVTACDYDGQQLMVGVAVAGSTQTSNTIYLGTWSGSQLSIINQNGSSCSGPLGASLLLTFDSTQSGGDLLVFWGQLVLSLPFSFSTVPQELIPRPASVQNTTPSVLDVAVTWNSNGQDVYYGIQSDGNLYSTTTGPGNFSWQNQLTQQTSLQSVSLVRVLAWPASGSSPDLIVMDTQNQLYHYDPGSTGAPLIALGQWGAQVVGGANREGYEQVFVTGIGSGSLYSLSADAETGDWTAIAVQLGSLGTVTPVITYTAELTVFDEVGLASPGHQVKVWSSSLVMLTVNGVTSWVDNERPAMCTTDTQGKVTIMYQTVSLSAPLLQVWTDYLDEGNTLIVEPNLAIQSTLREITWEDIYYAQSAPGQYLLPTNERTETTAQALATTITNAMTLVAPTTGSSTSRTMLRHHARSDKRFSSQINRQAVPEQHWSVDFSSGLPVFTTLTEEEARDMFACNQEASEAGSILNIDWGDIWEAVREGVGSVVKASVSTATDAIQVQIQCLIDGVQYLFNGLLSLVEQAFDIIEGCFETLTVTFEQVFGWLGFVFNWADIVRTKKAIYYMASQFFAVESSLLNYTQTQFNSFIQSYGSQITNFFSQLQQSLVSGQSLQSLLAEAPPAYPGTAQSTANNVVMTAFVNNAANSQAPSVPSRIASAEGGDDPVTQLYQLLLQYGQQFEASGTAFNNALTYFTDMAEEIQSNPLQALQSLVSALLSLAESLVQATLGTVQLIINALLNAITAVISEIQDILTAEWNIPYVTELYSYITSGGTLSALDLFSLLLAVPVTVFYKLLEQAAPFPDDASEQAFEASWSAQSILQAMGITSADEASGGAPTFSPPPKPTLIISLIVNYLASMGTAITAFWSDTQPPKPAGTVALPEERAWSVMTTFFELIAWGTSCPYFSTQTPTTTAWLVWGNLSFSWLVDGVCIGINWKIAEISGDYAVGVCLVVGILNVALYTFQWIKDHPAWYLVLANYLNGLPQVCKFLLLSAITTKPIVGQIAQVALGTFDAGGNAASTWIKFGDTLSAIYKMPDEEV